jgi:hypothetical protein
MAGRYYVELRGPEEVVQDAERCATAEAAIAWLVVRVDKKAGRTGRFVGRLADAQMLLFLSRFGVVPEPE